MRRQHTDLPYLAVVRALWRLVYFFGSLAVNFLGGQTRTMSEELIHDESSGIHKLAEALKENKGLTSLEYAATHLVSTVSSQ